MIRLRPGWIALVAVLITTHASYGQTDSLVLSSGTTAANHTVSLNLTLTSPAGSEPSAVQWSLTFPASNITSISATAGTSATNAGKILTCASGAGVYTCLATGMNANIITNGTLAVINVTVAAGVTSTSIGLGNSIASSGSGTAISLTVTGGVISSDATPPTVSITAPAANATVSNTITVSANASDNVAVADVQFQLDGVNLGADLTSAPYSISWNTTTVTNGSHTLTAIAHDTSGNKGTSTAVTVTVSNATGPPTSGLIGYWNFDEDTGTIAHDTSGSGYNGTVNNAGWVSGKVNSALSFNGSSSDVVTPNILLGGAFSISAWVNPAAAQGEYARIAETQYSPGFYLGTNFVGSGYKFIVNGASGATGLCGLSYGCAEGGTVTAGWHLVTATFDGTTGKLYVDGVLAGSDTFTPANTNLPLNIGRYFGSNGFGWNGVIDEVRLYNRALSAAEVTAIFSH